MHRSAIALAFLVLLGAASQVSAQAKVPFANGVPVAPEGLNNLPLGKGPFTYRTAEGQNIRVRVLARGLAHGYAMTFLPNGDLLITERAGRLRILRNGVLLPEPVAGAPETRSAGRSGLIGAVHGYMSVIAHPRFAKNGWIYLAYNKPLDASNAQIAVVRARLENNTLHDLKEIITGPDLHGAVALGMTSDGMLYIGTAGYVGDQAQHGSSLAGKVLRLRDDGSIPADNPFVGKTGHRPEVYALGFRSVLGMAVHPSTGEIWVSEMGPNGGDEIDVVKAGRDYGWPTVSLGRTYPGPWQSKINAPTHDGFELPVVYWMPSISVAGLTFYTGDRFPAWKGDLFVTGLRYGEVPGTGRLDRVLLNDKQEELRRETLLEDLHQRIRDVQQGPDGLLYVLTDEPKAAILRIEPIRQNP
jgi:glucose/arabinose dehydrogenase